MNNESAVSSVPKSAAKKRDSNLELFRIVTMLLIIAHHYVVNSELMSDDGPLTVFPTAARSLFLLLFGAWGKIGINCFVMITGYFMCKSQITAKKFAKLVGEWLFYRYVILLIFIVLGYDAMTLKSIIKLAIPISMIEQNFTPCFVVFWLFIPFLNKITAIITERQHLYLLMLLGFTYVLLGTIHRVSMNYVSWFVVLYFIASYIRLYPKKWMNNNVICGVFLLLSVALAAASIFVCVKTGRFAYYFVTDSNTVLAVIVGVFAFLFFRNIRIPYSRFINAVGASTFGVFLIHAHSSSMRKWLWTDTIDCVGHYGDKLMPLYAIGCVAGVFIACALIDMIRINLLEKPLFKLWDKHWEGFAKMFRNGEKKLLSKLNIE